VVNLVNHVYTSTQHSKGGTGENDGLTTGIAVSSGAG